MISIRFSPNFHEFWLFSTIVYKFRNIIWKRSWRTIVILFNTKQQGFMKKSRKIIEKNYSKLLQIPILLDLSIISFQWYRIYLFEYSKNLPSSFVARRSEIYSYYHNLRFRSPGLSSAFCQLAFVKGVHCLKCSIYLCDSSILNYFLVLV